MKVYGSEGVGDRVEKVVNTLRMWFEEYMHVSSTGLYENVGPSTCSGGNFTSDDNQDELDDWAMFVTQETTHIQMGKSELDLYLGEPNHPRNEDLDILDYWFKTLARYPTLALMARDLLTTLVSTVPLNQLLALVEKQLPPQEVL